MTKPKPSMIAIGSALAILYFVWGSTYVAIRVSVETIPPFMMAGGRFAVAGLIMAIIVSLTRGFQATPRQWFDNAISGFLMLVGGNGLVSWAEQRIPSGIATLIISANPVFFVVAEWLIARFSKDKTQGDRPSWLTFAGLLIGFIGLWILINPSYATSADETLEPWSVAALLTACLSWTIGSLFTRYNPRPPEAFTGASMQMLCAGVWLTLLSTLLGEWQSFDVRSVSTVSVFAWGYLVVAGSLIGFSSYVWLMKHCSPTVVSTYAYVNPIVAVFLGWWLLHEKLGFHVFTATIAIIVGVAMISLSKAMTRRAKVENAKA